MVAVSPTTVTTSPTAFTARIIASRTVVASVVKWAASAAGASRSRVAKSPRTNCANIRSCNSRITSSTNWVTSTVCPYWAAALAEVMATTKAGIWYSMRLSCASNMPSARLITTGYSAVSPAISAVSTSTNASRAVWCRRCSRHSRSIMARVVVWSCIAGASSIRGTIRPNGAATRPDTLQPSVLTGIFVGR